jgi:hypothetical protein
MPATNFRSFVTDLTKGIRVLYEGYGQRLVTGCFGLLSDCVAEACRQAMITAAPAHPECLEDGVDQCGNDRANIPRFRYDSLTQWRARVVRAWDDYEENGTAQVIKRLVDEFLLTLRPSGTSSTDVFENFSGLGPQAFAVVIKTADKPHSWQGPVLYGAGNTYGETNLTYGISGVDLADLQQLRDIIRKYKPARCHAYATIGGIVTIAI